MSTDFDHGSFIVIIEISNNFVLAIVFTMFYYIIVFTTFDVHFTIFFC